MSIKKQELPQRLKKATLYWCEPHTFKDSTHHSLLVKLGWFRFRLVSLETNLLKAGTAPNCPCSLPSTVVSQPCLRSLTDTVIQVSNNWWIGCEFKRIIAKLTWVALPLPCLLLQLLLSFSLTSPPTSPIFIWDLYIQLACCMLCLYFWIPTYGFRLIHTGLF